MTMLSTAELRLATDLGDHHVRRWEEAGVLIAEPRDRRSGVPCRWSLSEVVVARAVIDDRAAHLHGSWRRMDRARLVAQGARAAVEGHGRWLVVADGVTVQCDDWLAAHMTGLRTLIALRWQH